jgi:hypothetical protein
MRVGKQLGYEGGQTNSSFRIKTIQNCEIQDLKNPGKKKKVPTKQALKTSF